MKNYFKYIGGNAYIKNKKISIGFEWELLCKKICLSLYNKVLTNENYNSILPNSCIPDILCGDDTLISNGIVQHANVIVECKKSIYFTTFDFINNSTTAKYIEYCDELQYWVLQTPNEFINYNYKKIKYIFAEELLKDERISSLVKDEIKNLIDISQKLDFFKIKEANESQLIEWIEYIKNNAGELLTKKKQETRDKSRKVVRQYSLDGAYVQEYASTAEAAKAVQSTADNINNAISGRRSSCSGFIWRKCNLFELKGDIILTKAKQHVFSKIVQVDINGEVISEFATVAEAAKKIGIDRKGIRDVVYGRQKTAGGFFG